MRTFTLSDTEQHRILLVYLYFFSKHQANLSLFTDPEFLTLFQAVLQKDALQVDLNFYPVSVPIMNMV